MVSILCMALGIIQAIRGHVAMVIQIKRIGKEHEQLKYIGSAIPVDIFFSKKIEQRRNGCVIN